MNINKISAILLIAMCISTCCYADNSGYLKIIFKNTSAVPTYKMVVAQQGTFTTNQQVVQQYQLKFIDSNLTKLFANYTILDFEKEYPIADSFPDDQTPAVHLRLVFRIMIDTTTGKSYDGLKKSTDSMGSPLISTTIRQFPGVSLLTTPNDYYNTHNPPYEAAYQHLDLVNALNAWNITTGLSCIKIGIVDENFQHHEDLDNKIDSTPRTATIASSSLIIVMEMKLLEWLVPKQIIT